MAAQAWPSLEQSADPGRIHLFVRLQEGFLYLGTARHGRSRWRSDEQAMDDADAEPATPSVRIPEALAAFYRLAQGRPHVLGVQTVDPHALRAGGEVHVAPP